MRERLEQRLGKIRLFISQSGLPVYFSALFLATPPVFLHRGTCAGQREVLLCRLFQDSFLALLLLSLRLSAVQISLLIKLSIVLICWARGIC